MVCCLRLVIRLLPRPKPPANLLTLLQPLRHLGSDPSRHFLPHIAAGLAQLLSSGAACIADQAGWPTVFTLLEQCADHPEASSCVCCCGAGVLGGLVRLPHNHSHAWRGGQLLVTSSPFLVLVFVLALVLCCLCHSVAFEALEQLLRDPELRACVPLSAASPLTAFVRSPHTDRAHTAAALKLLFSLHERLVALIPRQYQLRTDGDVEMPVAGGTGTARDDDRSVSVKTTVWLSGWLPILQAMRTGCSIPDDDALAKQLLQVRLPLLCGVAGACVVRVCVTMCDVCVQRCLTDPATKQLPADVWSRVYDACVFPLVVHAVETASNSRGSQLQHAMIAVVDAVELLCHVFVHHTQCLSSLATFHEVFAHVRNNV